MRSPLSSVLLALSRSVACAGALAASACGGGDEADASDDPAPAFTGDGAAVPPRTPSSSAPATSPAAAKPTSAAIATDIDPQTATHPEVVYVLMKATDDWTWFCTGTLVSARVVVTAAHCLSEAQFVSWEVFAPTLAAKPRVKAKSVHMFDADYKDVTHPDLGIVVLDAGIELARYAELTDVTARVDGGEDATASAIVRTAEQPEAPLRKTSPMKLTSTVRYGYLHGFGVPLFSHGGDSGAGLFLVSNGQMTHLLVAVAREPDPARKLDQLSRVEADFASWVQATGAK
jgi:hypothetical protein